MNYYPMLVIWLAFTISSIVAGKSQQLIGLDLIMVAIFFELHFKPLKTYITRQLNYRREAAQRRRQYELFKAGVKSGLYATDDQVADENRRVIQ